MRLYVDFDDVLCETARALSELARALFGRDVPYDLIRAFDLQVAFDLDRRQYDALMAAAHLPDFLRTLAPTPGGVEGLRAWLRDGHDVVVVTGRPAAAHASSRAWLAQHGLDAIPLLHVDKYNRHTSSAPDAPPTLTLADLRREHFDVAIDDAPRALDALLARPTGKTIVFDRPWNREYSAVCLTRCANWQELTSTVRRLVDQP